MSKAKLDLVISGKIPLSLSAPKVRRLILEVLQSLKLRSAVLGVAFLPEGQMARKNKMYRRKSGPTDVLSFAYPLPKKGKMLLGDILICPKYAARQAKQDSIPLDEELKRLLIHGLLHLAGHDHVIKAQAKRMFSLQERILKSV
ncbi:MAG: rRNA maturation RNase YbeY [Patescibacteria group bacterium]